MPVIKLTRENVAKIVPLEKTTIWYDADLKGFGLRMTPKGAGAWIAEYRPGAGGSGVSKKRVKLGTVGTLAPNKAREAARRLLADATLGGDPAKLKAEERAGLSVRQLVNDYIERHVETKRKQATADFYRYLLKVHIGPHLGSRRAVSVERNDVGNMHAAAGRSAKYAANRAVAVLSAAFVWGAKAGLVPEGTNPAATIEPFPESARERFLTSEELSKLGEVLREAETVGLPHNVDTGKKSAKHARKSENRFTTISPYVTGAIRLLLFTGCRVREILDLEWKHVDVERGIAFLPDSKTGKKPVVLSRAALEVLATLPKIGKYVIASDSAGMNDERPRADLKRPWAAIQKRADLEGVRLHDLRHTFASIGAGGGLGLPIIGKLLGHSNAGTTQRYAHLATDPTREAADLIAGRIDAAMNGRSNG